MDLSAEIRALHLHTVESLCTDLISGRALGIGNENAAFQLPTVQARSVLQWYLKNRGKWAGNLMTPDAEAIVDSLLRHGIDTVFGLPGVQT